MKDLKYYAKKSINNKGTISLECNLTLDVDDEKFQAYEVSIGCRDLLFYCDKGVLVYVVDTYGERIAVELFEIERDNP